MNDQLRIIEEQKEADRKDAVVIRAFLYVFGAGILIGALFTILFFRYIM